MDILQQGSYKYHGCQFSVVINILFITFFIFFLNYNGNAQFEQYEWSKPQNLEILNSKADEFAPSYLKSANKLFFNSTKNGNSLFYFSQYSNDKELQSSFTNLVVLTDGLNKTSANQSYITFSGDELAYFTSFRIIPRGSVMNIYQSHYVKNNWEKGVLTASLESQNFRFNPTISPSGKIMIYSEASTENHEDSDLWIAYKNEKNEWTGAIRLDELNSNLAEITPFLASDDTLYFASNGFSGKGGYDIYYSINLNGKWQTPRPLNTLNTEYDESDFTRINFGLAIFSSNRPGGKGGLDLWATEFKSIQSDLDKPELKLASSISEIEITKFRKFIVTDKSILENIKIAPERYSLSNSGLLKIYTDSFIVKPEYLEITVYPKFTKEFSKIEIKVKTENHLDSFLLEGTKENSIVKLINLQKDAAKYVNSNNLVLSAAVVNQQDVHSDEKTKQIDLFNSTKEIPDEIKISGSTYAVALLPLPKNVNEEVLATKMDFIKLLKSTYRSNKKIMVESSPTYELTDNQLIRDWVKKAFFDNKEIIFQKNIYPKFSDYLTNSDFNYLLILIQI